ncbi:hypothetical protein BSKO_07077 [Bryopsis sp. KO-2023]|nr:hypothetical protein BSKO_07077 [Bryopsis sp. KO-2023]
MSSAEVTLALFLLALSLPSFFADDIDIRPSEPGFEFPDEIWLKYVLKYEDDLGIKSASEFCLGDKVDDWKSLLRESLPGRWPVQQSNEPVCSVFENAVDHICKLEDLKTFLRFIVRTDNPEKIPSTEACRSGNSTSGGCWPGFFEFEGSAMPCCDGFFCPRMLTCMIPCPLGAHCVRAKSSKPPPAYGGSSDDWCAPYAYKTRGGKCGGADKWSMKPNSAFPGVNWEGGSGNIYCPAGSFCGNTTTDPVPCPHNHHCRWGATTPTYCPPLVNCKGGTKMPQDNYLGLAFDAGIFILLLVLWQASKLHKWMLRRMSARDRIKIQFGGSRAVCRVTTIARPETPPGPSTPPSLPASQSGSLLRQMSTNLGRSMHRMLASKSKSVNPNRQDAVWADLVHSDDSDSSVESGDDNDNLDMPIIARRPTIGVFGEFSIDMDAVDEHAPTISIEFYGLNLKLKSCAKCVLTAASGRLREARLTAIMGPSGAGKTSLLNALAGKASYGVLSGMVMVNGQEASLEKYKQVMGFVPQDDIMHTDLTVEENLLFSARYRLPENISHSARVAMVDRAIQILGLNGVRHELIGNEETRGISGGQRKRVNVGLELVSDPRVLLLDEPTSGLDSSSCKQVVSTLKTIAHMGVTSAAVVHQPSYRVMKMFDDLLLLGNGGVTVYNGPEDRVQDYFEGLGFMFPSRANPGDVCLDIIAGHHEREGFPEFLVEDLVGIWDRSDMHAQQMTLPDMDRELSRAMTTRVNEVIQGGASRSLDLGGVHQGCCTKVFSYVGISVFIVTNAIVEAVKCISNAVLETVKCISQGFGQARDCMCACPRASNGYQGVDMTNSKPFQRTTPGFFRQFWWILSRVVLQRSRAPLALFVEYAIFGVTGMVLGLVADMRHKSGLGVFGTDMMHSCVGIGLLSCVAALRTFGQTRTVFYRESARGINKLAFFIAVDVFGVTGAVLRALCFTLPYYSYAQPRASLASIYIVTAFLVYCWTGMAYIISQVLNYSASQLASAVLVLMNTLLARSTYDHGMMHVVRNIIFTRWAMQAYIIAEAHRLTGVWLLERCFVLKHLGYSVGDYPWALFALFLLGFGCRVIALGMLFVLNRDKQQ